MRIYLYLSVKGNDLESLQACVQVANYLSLNKDLLSLKNAGYEFEHSYALYEFEADDYANLKAKITDAVIKRLFNFDVMLLQQIPSLERPGVLLMDMDMTSVQIEGIDEIARCLNVYDKVAAITHEAMNGKLDFAGSLRKRVALLKDGSSKVLDKVKAIMTETSGLDHLIYGLKKNNWKVGIASGGFVQLICVLEEKYGLDLVRANSLEICDGKFTGAVEGEIIDAVKKKEALFDLLKKAAAPLSQSVVLGDGANDLQMINAAALGIAYHAKPKVEEKALACLNYSDLSAVLLLLQSAS